MNGLFRSSADLFAELNRMQTLLDQGLRTPWQAGIRAQPQAFPVVNVGTTPEAIEIMALAPGLDPNSLELSVDRGVLIIAGERKSEIPADDERISVYARERFAGRFRRVVSLPEDADATRVQAQYRDGILRITVAKRESSRPRRIEVH